ncbi:hypothetical protein CSKR_108886 [Clonorchis sinensis]|uniref:Uncharacterized protein n=1 Tax=Clonorchis sinensis TaxID=79923 RepID=A0A419PDE1_CLOSI|nr:hypothetical protein CSKR_108886 [Clonorchis sinensis]
MAHLLPKLLVEDCSGIRNVLLIRSLKILRKPTTGFALPVQAHQATECAAPGRLMFQLLRYSRYRDTCIYVMYYTSTAHDWCSTFSCLETSKTGDSAGFQVVHVLRQPKYSQPQKVDDLSVLPFEGNLRLTSSEASY